MPGKRCKIPASDQRWSPYRIKTHDCARYPYRRFADTPPAAWRGSTIGRNACKSEKFSFFIPHAWSQPPHEAAVNWIIANQLGRRNLTPEQKSYLRGKRYNLEKKREGAPEGNQNAAKQRSENQNVETTRDRLAKEYGVTGSTISEDAEFAEGVDTLEEKVCKDIRQSVLKRKSRDDQTRTPTRAARRAGRLAARRSAGGHAAASRARAVNRVIRPPSSPLAASEATRSRPAAIGRASQVQTAYPRTATQPVQTWPRLPLHPCGGKPTFLTGSPHRPGRGGTGKA
jgi:hypothetical protein